MVEVVRVRQLECKSLQVQEPAWAQSLEG